MEKEVKLKTKDGHTIYGILNEPKKKTGKIIVFVHGLAGSPTESKLHNSAVFFTEKGYATLRIALYGHQKDARTLRDVSISTHAEDVSKSLSYVGKKFRKVFLVGHSLGPPSVSMAEHRGCSAIVLWDPSVFSGMRKGEIKYNKCIDAYLIDFGIEIVIGKSMVNEYRRSELIKDIIKPLKNPTKVICAGKGILHKHWKKNMKHFEVPAEYVEIKGARHNFEEWGAEERLFKETLKWIRKYS